ncbi:hypothetical protein JIG36_45375 [Actinoplanes sp. LDG1-06]|uniref:Uncharacterized protein n=1 Tax=Paractinoplanes ovalisporus TaxID=2810368 RepID=A0ABS2ASG6_9ACTN|nr:hypothetical protein [Actinoplanes ovalisporus]MBM2622756.1 hypothetical protein [Actinoplanes ovalisporus]
MHDFGLLVERLVARFGLWKVATTPFAVVPIFVAFGLVVGARFAAFIGVVAAFSTCLVVIVALGAQVRRERRLRAGLDRAVMRLTDTIYLEATTASYVWERWREETTVSRNGDTVIKQWRTLRVNPGATLRVIWVGQTQTAGHVSDYQRRHLRVDAYDFSQKQGNIEVGVQYDVATVWLPREQALVMYLCLDQPLSAGQTMNVLVVWKWPGMYRELLAGGKDEMSITRKRADARRIDVGLTFDKSCRLTRKMRILPLNGCARPAQNLNDDGSLDIAVTYGPSNVPEIVGFILDNKP